MTLTDILPTLRRSLPDPINIDRWPELTHPTTTDVVVSGISMVRLTELCGTPCVHTGAAVIPGTHGRPSPTAEAAVVIVSVLETTTSITGKPVVLIDACLDRVPAVWAEARLIGRVSTAQHHATSVVFDLDALNETAPTAELPDDMQPGDLLSIPCAGMVVLRNLRACPAEGIAANTDPQTPRWLSGLQ